MVFLAVKRLKPGAVGALIGTALGLLISIISQTIPRLSVHPGILFTGAPQGLDQWTYFSMIRALWRSPNGITYSYPYQLWWETPPVLFQMHFTLMAWLAKLTGLPMAFEIARVAGAAASGAALGGLGRALVRHRDWRKWFYVAAVAGGGWFGAAEVAKAIEVAGLLGLTEPWQYGKVVQGSLYWWNPFLAQNLRMPLECVYHGLALGVFYCLVAGRQRWAALLGAAAWFSNPFTAVTISAAALPWWAWRVAESPGQLRAKAVRGLGLWILITGLGLCYYGPFLSQWPALKDLTFQYSQHLTPPLDFYRLFLLVSPWMVFLVWSVASASGRRHVWGRPVWRLFALLAATQLILLQQGWIVGDKAVQPMHYNRGYLHLGLVVVAWRGFTLLSRALKKRARPAFFRCVQVLVLISCLDQALFAAYNLVAPSTGFVGKDYARLVDLLPGEGKSLTVLVEPLSLTSSYVTAHSNHVSYDAEETMVVPFPEIRRQKLALAKEGRGLTVADLGISRAILATTGSMYRDALNKQGWTVSAEAGSLVLLIAPDS